MGLPFSPLLNYMQTRTDIPKLLMPVCHISAHKRVLMITIWDPNLGPLQGGSYDNFDLLSCNPPFCITAYPLPFLFPVGGYSPVPGQGCSPARSFCQHSTDTQPCAAARPGQVYLLFPGPVQLLERCSSSTHPSSEDWVVSYLSCFPQPHAVGTYLQESEITPRSQGYPQATSSYVAY